MTTTPPLSASRSASIEASSSAVQAIDDDLSSGVRELERNIASAHAALSGDAWSECAALPSRSVFVFNAVRKIRTTKSALPPVDELPPTAYAKQLCKQLDGNWKLATIGAAAKITPGAPGDAAASSSSSLATAMAGSHAKQARAFAALPERMLDLLMPEQRPADASAIVTYAAGAGGGASLDDALVDGGKAVDAASFVDALARSLPPAIATCRLSDAQMALSVDPRRRPQPWEERVTSRALVRVLSLALSGPCSEPLFARIALFDLATMQRVTETMHVDCNDQSTAALLGATFSPDRLTSYRSAVLTANAVSRSVALVVEIYHVPSSDVDTAIERYSKAKKDLKDKDRARFEAETAEACARAGRHRQLLAVAAVRLFDNAGAFRLGGESGDAAAGGAAAPGDASSVWKTAIHKDGRPYYYNRVTKETTWTQPAELASRALASVPGVEGSAPMGGGEVTLSVSRLAKSGDALQTARDIVDGKGRPIPGRVTLWLGPLPNPRPNGRLNSELHPINPPGGDADPVVRELQGFSPPMARPYPLVAFGNSIFVYPHSVNLSSVGGAMSTARNVCVSIKLLESDADDAQTAVGLPLWLGDSSQTTFVREVRTEVHYHAKKPAFHSEFKLRLPLQVTDRHHLVFTVSHVPFDSKKKAADEVIGLAVVPLLNPDGSLVGSLGALMDESFSAAAVAAADQDDGEAPLAAAATLDAASVAAAGDADGDLVSRHVPLAAQLPPGYLALLREEGGVRMLDRRAVLRFDVRRADCVQPRAAQLARLFRGYSRFRSSPADADEAHLRSLLQDAAANAPPASVAEHYGALSYVLIDLIGASSEPTAQAALRTWAALTASVASVQARDPFVDGFVHYLFDLPRVADAAAEPLEPGLASAALHERFCEVLVAAVARTDDADVVMPVLAPLFGLLVKIIVVRLHRAGLLDDESTRARRASATLLALLGSLVATLALQVLRVSWLAPALACSASAATACLLKDLLDVFDRSAVASMIATFVQTLLSCRRVAVVRGGGSAAANVELDDARIDVGVTRACAAVAFAVLGSHQRFAALCVPLAVRSDALADPLRQWRRRHALAAVGLGVFDDALHRAPLSLPLVSLAANAVRAVLQRHLVYDDCLADDAALAREARSRVASLYYPFVLSTIDHVDVLQKWPTAVQQDVLLPFLEILNHLPDHVCDGLRTHTSALRHSKLFATLRLCVGAFQYVGKKKLHQLDRLRALDAQAWRALRRSNETSLRDSRRHASARQQHQRTATAAAAATATAAAAAVPPDDTERVWLALCESISDATARAAGDGDRTTAASASAATASLLCGALAGTTGVSDAAASGGAAGDPRELAVRLHATAQASKALALTSLVATGRAALRLACGAFRREIVQSAALGDTALGVLTALLQQNVHAALIEALLRTWRSLSHQFARSLFCDATGLLGDLCDVVVMLLEWPDATLRQLAASLFLALCEDCYAVAPNFARLRLQSSIAVSRLAGLRGQERRAECADAKGDARATYPDDFALLTATLQSVKEASARRRNAATATIGELVDRLFGVTACMAEMRATAWDYDKTVDLMHRMALSFNDTPDLKVTWLENLARYHDNNKRAAESVQATLLAAAHVSEALRRLARVRRGAADGAGGDADADADADESDDASDDASEARADAHRDGSDRRASLAAREAVGWSVWGARHSSNVARALDLPSAVALQQMSADVCRARPFTAAGYVSLLRDAVRVLRAACEYEDAVDIYNLMLPVFEADENFGEQAECHGAIADLCQQIVDEEQAGTRLWPIYYLVSFLGEPFRKDGLADCRFVYREPGTVRIAELSGSLQEQYSKRLGIDVTIINTKVVDVGKLDLAARAYIQVVSVEPQATDDDGAEAMSRARADAARRTATGRVINCAVFALESPFWRDADASKEDVTKTWKRRVLLHTTHTFPYLSRRQRVQREEVLELPPVEAARELLDTQRRELARELRCAAPRPNVVQMALQGSLLLQVNQGPLAIGDAFLGGGGTGGGSTPAQQHALRSSFLRFMQTLQLGVETNRRLIGADQQQFQVKLEEGLVRFIARCASKWGIDVKDTSK
jgi:hypothetical protein